MVVTAHVWHARRWTVYLTLVASTLAWSLSFVSFLEAKHVVLWAGIGVLALLRARSGSEPRGAFLLFAPFWIGLLAAVATGPWVARVPLHVLVEGLRVLGMLLFAGLASEVLQADGERRRVALAVVVAGSLAALLALLQYAGGLQGLFPVFAHYDQAMYSVFGNRGLLGGYLALSLVALLGLMSGNAFQASGTRFRTFLYACGLLLFGALLLSQSRAGLVALLAGVFGLILLRQFSIRQFGRVALGGAMVVVLAFWCDGGGLWSRWLGVLSPGDVGGGFRPWVWRSAVDLFVAHPITGVGLGNFATAIPEYLGMHAAPVAAEVGRVTTYHAHLDALELLCETGLIGLVLMVWGLSRLRETNPQALCCIVTLAVFSLFYPAWYSTPHAVAGLLFFALCTRPFAMPVSVASGLARYGRAGYTAMVMVVAVGGAGFVVLDAYPSYLLRSAEARHLSGAEATAAYERAVAAWGAHPEAYESYGIYAYEQGNAAKAEALFSRAREGVDTGRIYQLQALAAEAQGHDSAACTWYRQCLARWPWDETVRARVRSGCTSGTPGS